MTTRTITIISLVTNTALVALGNAAFAETPPESATREHRDDDTMPAIKGGLEISLAGNATQTVGDIGNRMDAGDTVGTASGLDLQIGYRMTPNLAFAFYATAQSFADGNARSGDDVHTGSAGFEADFHFRPNRSIDPWVSIGAGVRALLIDADAGNTILVGAELARLQLGADFRINENLALGPVIGASATLYGAQKDPMQDFEEVENKGLNWTFSLGLAGRFNAFGTRI